MGRQRGEHADHFLMLLVRHDPHEERHAPVVGHGREERADVLDRAGDALRVVRAVVDHQRIACEDLESRLPAGLVKTVSYGILGNLDVLCPEQVDRREDRRSVAGLIESGEPDRHVPFAEAEGGAVKTRADVGDLGKVGSRVRTAPLFRGPADHRLRVLVALSEEDRDARLDDPGFFRGDHCRGIAEDGAVVEGYARDDREDARPDHVRRVPAPAEPAFEDDEIASGAPVIHEGDGRDEFKFRRRVLHALRGVFHGLRVAREVLVGDRLAVEHDPLVEAFHVRRGVQADAVTRRTEHGREHRRGRSLAVGPRDVEETEAVFGMAEPLREG